MAKIADEQQLKPCPCGCGIKTAGGRYAREHKATAVAVARATASAPGDRLLVRNLLLIECVDELADRVWGKLRLDQKVTALNSLKK
jgi:hypothetical protein